MATHGSGLNAAMNDLFDVKAMLECAKMTLPEDGSCNSAGRVLHIAEARILDIINNLDALETQQVQA